MFRLPDPVCHSRRSFSAHFKSLQKPQLSESRIFQKKSSQSLIHKKDPIENKTITKSMLIKQMMKKKMKEQE